MTPKIFWKIARDGSLLFAVGFILLFILELVRGTETIILSYDRFLTAYGLVGMTELKIGFWRKVGLFALVITAFSLFFYLFIPEIPLPVSSMLGTSLVGFVLAGLAHWQLSNTEKSASIQEVNQ